MPEPSRVVSSWDVVGVGANSVDFVYLVPGYPERHGAFSKMRISGQRVCAGGQMATALATCARLGLRAKYIGATGSDANGALIRERLGSLGIDTTSVVTRKGHNQFAVILVERPGAAGHESLVFVPPGGIPGSGRTRLRQAQ